MPNDVPSPQEFYAQIMAQHLASFSDDPISKLYAKMLAARTVAAILADDDEDD
jgi:hypothetical protein